MLKFTEWTQHTDRLHVKKNIQLFIHSTGDTIPLCEKGTGTLEGKPAVLRRCGTGDSQADGMCKHHSFLEIGDKSTHDAYVCACAGDKCNGASNLQFTNFSFFAFAVHVLYKLVLY